MGNGRKGSGNQNNLYITEDGLTLNREGHTDEWFDDFLDKVGEWVLYGENSPDSSMNDDEIQYIKNNMSDSENNPDIPSGHLTRVENGYHIMPLIESGELKIGDTLPSTTNFRSFSKTQIGTLNASVFKDYANTIFSEKIVIYRTNGNVKHFDLNKITSSSITSAEKESLIDPTTLKIDKITRFPAEEIDGGFTHNKLYKELGVFDEDGVEDVELYGFNEVVLIDVSSI